jgi:hypothetical protein
MPWRNWFCLFLMLIAAGAAVYGSSTVRLPDLMISGSLSFQQEEALHQLRLELVQRSSNSSIKAAPLLLPGTMVAALLSQQSGSGVIVTPSWIGILPKNMKEEHIRFWKLLFEELEKQIARYPTRGDTVFIFEPAPLSMESLLSEESEKKLTFFAPEVLQKALESSFMNRITESMVPVRLSASGSSRVSMLKMNIMTLQEITPPPVHKVGEEIMVVYQGGGIRLRFRGKIDRIDRNGGTVSVRPLSNLFSPATAGNSIRRFEASITGNGEADVQIGGEQQ